MEKGEYDSDPVRLTLVIATCPILCTQLDRKLSCCITTLILTICFTIFNLAAIGRLCEKCKQNTLPHNLPSLLFEEPSIPEEHQRSLKWIYQAAKETEYLTAAKDSPTTILPLKLQFLILIFRF